MRTRECDALSDLGLARRGLAPGPGPAPFTPPGAACIVRACLRSGCGAAADVARSTVDDPGMIPCRPTSTRRSMIVPRGIGDASGAGCARIAASRGTRSINSGQTSPGEPQEVRAAAPARKVRRFPQPALVIGADVRLRHVSTRAPKCEGGRNLHLGESSLNHFGAKCRDFGFTAPAQTMISNSGKWILGFAVSAR